MHQAINIEVKIFELLHSARKATKMYIVERHIISTETSSFLYTLPLPLPRLQVAKNKTHRTAPKSYLVTVLLTAFSDPESTAHSMSSNRLDFKPAAVNCRCFLHRTGQFSIVIPI